MDGLAAMARGGLRRAYGPLADGRTWRATLYHLLDLPMAWIAGAIVLVGLFASVALAPLAVLVLAGAVAGVRRVAAVERARARALLGITVEAPPSPERQAGLVEWITATLKDTAGWRALGYMVVRFGLGNAAFLMTAVAWWVTLALLTTPVWADSPFTDAPRPGDMSSILDVWWEHLLAVTAGLLGLALVPRGMHGLAWLSAWSVQALLGPGADVRIRQLQNQRSSAVRVADVERRRIEQDLHDGAQVRLTALAMNLGLAKEAIADGVDPARIADLVDDAHAQAKLALREIRDLARGIHPAILTDRGLDAALTSMVGRLPLPVDMDIDVPERPSPEVESIAYFVAAEAVTNAVRHADTEKVGVRVVRDTERVVVEVRDRGRGGADPERGTGLANLRQRVESAGGELTVLSPEGVGTLVRAVVPCAS